MLGYGCREPQQPAKAPKPLEEELVETPMLASLVHQEAAVGAEFLDPWLGLMFASLIPRPKYSTTSQNSATL